MSACFLAPQLGFAQTPAASPGSKAPPVAGQLKPAPAPAPASVQVKPSPEAAKTEQSVLPATPVVAPEITPENSAETPKEGEATSATPQTQSFKNRTLVFGRAGYFVSSGGRSSASTGGLQVGLGAHVKLKDLSPDSSLRFTGQLLLYSATKKLPKNNPVMSGDPEASTRIVFVETLATYDKMFVGVDKKGIGILASAGPSFQSARLYLDLKSEELSDPIVSRYLIGAVASLSPYWRFVASDNVFHLSLGAAGRFSLSRKLPLYDYNDESVNLGGLTSEAYLGFAWHFL